MEVMGGHFVGMDPPDELADVLVVCCGRGLVCLLTYPILPDQ